MVQEQQVGAGTTNAEAETMGGDMVDELRDAFGLEDDPAEGLDAPAHEGDARDSLQQIEDAANDLGDGAQDTYDSAEDSRNDLF